MFYFTGKRSALDAKKQKDKTLKKKKPVRVYTLCTLVFVHCSKLYVG